MNLSFALEWASHIWLRGIEPVQPGHFGQCDTAVKEIASRLFFGLLSIPIGVVGLSARLVSEISPQKPFEYQTGCLDKPFDPKEPFTHLTLNVCCMGGGLPQRFGGASPWWHRIDSLTQLFEKADADILSLQEMHSPWAAQAFVEKLKNRYAHFYYNIGPKRFSLNSGLFVASKFPIQNPEFIPFNVAGQTRGINKGFFRFVLGEGRCDVIVVHLQPGEGKNHIREQQLASITQSVNEQKATLIAGDFNIENRGAEFPESFGQMQAAEKATSTKYFRYMRRGKEAIDKEAVGHVVDYAFFRGGTIETTLFKTFSYQAPDSIPTDHRGLLSRLQIFAHLQRSDRAGSGD